MLIDDLRKQAQRNENMAKGYKSQAVSLSIQAQEARKNGDKDMAKGLMDEAVAFIDAQYQRNVVARAFRDEMKKERCRIRDKQVKRRRGGQPGVFPGHLFKKGLA
mgnify:CR=1 FL=1